MITKYMTVDGKYFDSDIDLIKIITGDGASFYLTSEHFDRRKTKSLNTSEVTE
jgi:hypothetical protein